MKPVIYGFENSYFCFKDAYCLLSWPLIDKFDGYLKIATSLSMITDKM
jgi:hypothetical protein